MSKSIALKRDFSMASEVLQGVLINLQSDLQQFCKSTHDAYVKNQVKLAENLNKWKQNLESYQVAIQKMPKELRKREIVKGILKDLEKFDIEFNKGIAQVKELPFEEYKNNFQKWLEVQNSHFQDLQLSAQSVASRLSELDSHPLIQKCLRGETILSSRKNIQWGRKVGHALFGIFFAYLFVFASISKPVIYSLTAVFVLWAFSLEYARHVNPKVNEWVCKYFKPVMRENEKNKINSAIFYMVSMLLVYFIFPIQVSFITILFLAVGDTVAGVIGVYFGKRKLTEHVSLEGFMACWATCSFLALFSLGLFFDFEFFSLKPYLFALMAGFCGAVAEGSFKKIDDNFVMPMISAPLLLLLLKMFAFF